METSEVAEADEVNEATEVSKGSKNTTEDFRVESHTLNLFF